jgi:hypothetical protein
MVGCVTKEFIGRETSLEFALVCDTDPESGSITWLPIGALTSKSLSVAGNAVSVFADDSGEFDPSILANKALEITAEGISRRVDDTLANQVTLFLHYANSSEGMQPNVMIRYTRPDVTLVTYMLITDMSPSDPSDTNSTFALSLTRAPSAFAPHWSLTPQP